MRDYVIIIQCYKSIILILRFSKLVELLIFMHYYGASRLLLCDMYLQCMVAILRYNLECTCGISKV